MRVDQDAGVIHGVPIAKLGPWNQGRGRFDETQLDSLVRLGNAGSKGVRLWVGYESHKPIPFLGRATNFRRIGTQVLSDWHVSPNSYFRDPALSVLDDDPSAFGCTLHSPSELVHISMGGVDNAIHTAFPAGTSVLSSIGPRIDRITKMLDSYVSTQQSLTSSPSLKQEKTMP